MQKQSICGIIHSDIKVAGRKEEKRMHEKDYSFERPTPDSAGLYSKSTLLTKLNK